MPAKRPPPKSQERDVVETFCPWQVFAGTTGLEIIGDNQTVINWTNGVAKVDDAHYIKIVADTTCALYCAWRVNLIVPRLPHSDWARHVYREFNAHADKLATQAILFQASDIQVARSPSNPTKVRAHFDGGCREGLASAGWTLEGSWSGTRDDGPWKLLATGSIYLGALAAILQHMRNS